MSCHRIGPSRLATRTGVLRLKILIMRVEEIEEKEKRIYILHRTPSNMVVHGVGEKGFIGLFTGLSPTNMIPTTKRNVVFLLGETSF